jgi:hypothetical protein
MMRHFEVDPVRIAPAFGAALRNAERICANCFSVGRCRRWFHRQLTDDAPRLFCPNAHLYEDIAINQKRHTRMRWRRHPDDRELGGLQRLSSRRAAHLSRGAGFGGERLYQEAIALHPELAHAYGGFARVAADVFPYGREPRPSTPARPKKI